MIAHNNAQYASDNTARILLIMPLCMAIFYTVRQILKWMDRSRRWLTGLTVLMLFYLLGVGLAYGYVYSFTPWVGIPIQPSDTTYSHAAFLRSVFLFYTRFSFFAFAVFLLEKCVIYAYGKMQDRARIAELKANTGLLAVHFLGNVLQRYYADLGQRHAEVAEQVDGLIQYAIDTQNAENDTLIPLRTEINQLKALMMLHQVGRPDGPYVTLELPDHYTGYKVPRLTFITAYENILKHGITDDPARPARMQLKMERGAYHFRTYNRVSEQPRETGNRASMGLEIIRSRLQLKLKGKFTLSNRRQGNRFLFHLYVKT